MSDNIISKNLNVQFNQSIKATMDDNSINDGNLINEGAYDENQQYLYDSSKNENNNNNQTKTQELLYAPFKKNFVIMRLLIW